MKKVLMMSLLLIGCTDFPQSVDVSATAALQQQSSKNSSSGKSDPITGKGFSVSVTGSVPLKRQKPDVEKVVIIDIPKAEKVEEPKDVFYPAEPQPSQVANVTDKSEAKKTILKVILALLGIAALGLLVTKLPIRFKPKTPPTT